MCVTFSQSSTDIPQPKALPSKVKEVQQVLHSIKNSCNTLETNLCKETLLCYYPPSLGTGLFVATVLESPKSTEKSNKTLKKESKDLLKEVRSRILVVYDDMCCVQIQLKYANVRKKSLRTTSELSTSLK